MRRTLIPTLAMVGLVLPAAVVRAEGSNPAVARSTSFDVELFGGGHVFKRDTNLGVAAAPDATAGARSNAVAGVRAGLGLTAWSKAEVELLGMITSDRTYDRRAQILGYRLTLLAYLLPGNLRPYLLVGAGAMQVVTTRADGTAGMVHDRDGEFHVGGGVDYRFHDHLAVRLDARAVEMPGKQEASLSADLEATLALVFRFGAGPRLSPAAAVAVERPQAKTNLAALVPAEPAPETVPAQAAPAPPTAPPPARAPSPAAPAASSPTPAGPAGGPGHAPLPPIKALLGRAKEIKFEGSSPKLSLVSLPLIGQLAEALTKDVSIELEIVAHTAASGDAARDKALSKRRAEAVKRALVERDIAPSRLLVTARGSEDPLAPNVTRSGRKLNERVELRLLVPDTVTR